MLESPDSVRRVAATGMVGRRDQANRATVPPAHCAMLPRLDAKTRPARSETMVVVRSRAISAIHLGRNRLTSKASRVLRPAGLLNRPRRPLSRGFDQAGCPARPLVSYQINRQLSGWNLPPLVIRAVGAHVESRTGAVAWAMRQRSVSRPRSSNRTCGFPASGFPTGFTSRHTAGR